MSTIWVFLIYMYQRISLLEHTYISEFQNILWCYFLRKKMCQNFNHLLCIKFPLKWTEKNINNLKVKKNLKIILYFDFWYNYSVVRMAERSKAPDSSLAYAASADRVFWSPSGGVGSNPTSDTHFFTILKKSKFWSKLEIFVENRNFGQKSKFCSNIKILVENRSFARKSKFYSNIKLLVENWSFAQKSKFCSNIESIFRQKQTKNL